MKIDILNSSDYRLHAPKYIGNKIIIELKFLYSEDGLRYYHTSKQIELLNRNNWPLEQEEFGEKLLELENGNLLG